MKKFLYSLCFFGLLFTSNLNAEILKKVEIQGNSRISSETIKVYGEIELNKDYSNDDINSIIKKLYNTKFFSKIGFKFLIILIVLSNDLNLTIFLNI